MQDKILKGVCEYYTNKLEKFGDTHLGVDWNSKASQYLRFEQLSKVINENQFSVLDYGCGYGELVNYLSQVENFEMTYFGYDISKEMLRQARSIFKYRQNVAFLGSLQKQKFDFVIASGVLNVKLNLASDNEWLDYVITMLNQMNELSVKGFSFNALTVYSEKKYMKDYLYYADPIFLFDYCKKHFSKDVALLHDYKLYEFTLIIRKWIEL
ncbi:MAG: methyltransferase domain-containing protein [Bacteroidetes bacterium]|nr:methyltransferase domain-containing protein [bacterium]NBP65988.1 methyltransferase domain-containing protein [Bacteroidota bacterium]